MPNIKKATLFFLTTMLLFVTGPSWCSLSQVEISPFLSGTIQKKEGIYIEKNRDYGNSNFYSQLRNHELDFHVLRKNKRRNSNRQSKQTEVKANSGRFILRLPEVFLTHTFLNHLLRDFPPRPAYYAFIFRYRPS